MHLNRCEISVSYMYTHINIFITCTLTFTISYECSIHTKCAVCLHVHASKKRDCMGTYEAMTISNTQIAIAYNQHNLSFISACPKGLGIAPLMKKSYCSYSYGIEQQGMCCISGLLAL